MDIKQYCNKPTVPAAFYFLKKKTFKPITTSLHSLQAFVQWHKLSKSKSERERDGLVQKEQVPHSLLCTRGTRLCLRSFIHRVQRYRHQTHTNRSTASC